LAKLEPKKTRKIQPFCATQQIDKPKYRCRCKNRHFGPKYRCLWINHKQIFF